MTLDPVTSDGGAKTRGMAAVVMDFGTFAVVLSDGEGE
jgi:hypothetical protein